MRAPVLWLTLLSGVGLACALYEDQAGTFDWYKPYVGHVLSASFHKTKPRLYVSTEQGVVGALNLRDGSIAFRHKVSGDSDALQPTSSLLLDTPAVFVTLAASTLSVWDQTDGVSKWSAELPKSSEARHSQVIAAITKDIAPAIPGDGARIGVLAGGELKVYDSATGAVPEAVSLTSEAAAQSVGLLQATPSLTAYTFTPGSTIVHITSLGGASSVTSPVALSSIAAAGPAGFAALSSDYAYICATGSQQPTVLQCTSLSTVSSGAVTAGASARLVSTSSGWAVASGDAAAPGAILLKADTASGAVSKVASFSAASEVSNALSGPSDEHLAVVEVQADGVVIEYVSTTTGASIIKEGPVKGARSEILAPGVTPPGLKTVFIGSFKKRDQSLGFRALLVWDDERISSVQQGLTVWSRDEAQAGVTSALVSDLPPAAAMAPGTQPDFKQQMKQFLHLQLLSAKVQFKLSTNEELAEFTRLRSELSDKQLPTRDSRGFRRSFVVTTASGKVAALHNGDGHVIWSRPGGPRQLGVAAAQRLIHWRTYHDLTHPPLVAVLSGGGQAGSKPHLSVLDVYTGKEVEAGPLGYSLDKLVPIGQVSDGEHADQQVYLAVDLTAAGSSKPQVHLLPDTPLTRSHFASHYRSLTFFIDSANGPDSPAFQGFGFDAAAAAAVSAGSPATALPTWSLTLPAPVLSWAAVDPQDPIHTSVKVLGDRSMKYRYLNPNTLLVVTGLPAGVPATRDDIPTMQAVIYVVDTVTGAVRYQQTAPSTRGPATCTITGNLAVVQLWDAAAARFSITSLELYDASERQFSVLDHMFNPNATQPQSSYRPPPLEVLTASFFTRTPAKALTTSRTRAGITSKMLLFLTQTDQVFALDMRFIDPRRPHRTKLTPEEQEERLVPYQDTLPLAPSAFVTYNKQVLGLKQVIAAPSRLESTSLLFSYGIDLQYTRVAPAKGFDSLDDDFSYGLLVVALVMLLVSSAFMHVFTKKSMLKAKWQ